MFSSSQVLILLKVKELIQLWTRCHHWWNHKAKDKSRHPRQASEEGTGHLLKSLAVLTSWSHRCSFNTYHGHDCKMWREQHSETLLKVFSVDYIASRRGPSRGNPIMSDPLTRMSGEAWGGLGWLLVGLSLIPPKGHVSIAPARARGHYRGAHCTLFGCSGPWSLQRSAQITATPSPKKPQRSHYICG